MDLVVKLLLLACLIILFNIIIDYFILKESDDLFIFVKNIPKNKKKIFTYIVSVIIQCSLFIVMGSNPLAYLYYILILIFYRIAIIDYKTKYIDNGLLILLMLVGVLSLAINSSMIIIQRIVTGIVVYVCLAILSKLTNEALGMGDAKILGILGIIFGFQGVTSILLVSSILAFFVSIYLLIKSRENRKKELPFTPYIYISILFMLIINNI